MTGINRLIALWAKHEFGELARARENLTRAADAAALAARACDRAAEMLKKPPAPRHGADIEAAAIEADLVAQDAATGIQDAMSALADARFDLLGAMIPALVIYELGVAATAAAIKKANS